MRSSWKSCCFWDGGLVDPHQVPGFDVVPLFFDFVVSGPHEGSVQVFVEGVQSASGNRFDVLALEEERITGAHALDDQSGVSHGWVTERTISISLISIWDIDSLSSICLKFHVWLWAHHLFARVLRMSIGCVEAT